MSKRSKNQAMYQPSSVNKRRAPVGKAASGNAAGKSAAGRAVSKTARPGAARVYERPATRRTALPNLLTVRIVAIVVAVAAVVGGTAWALSTRGGYGTGEIIGLIALGFLAGLGIAVALRTEAIVTQVIALIAKNTRR